jgi:hypothetical protein
VTTRRNPGEGGLHWEESRQRWFATVYVGYSPDGKRRKVKVSARTKTEAKGKLQRLLRDRDDGHVLGGQNYTGGTPSSLGSLMASSDARSRRWSIAPSSPVRTSSRR